MGNVISLSNYKRKTRQAYLARHGSRIDRMVESFVRKHVDVDFQQLAEDYQSGRYGLEQASWDYVHFREILAEALDEVFGRALYDQLRAQPWFDSSLIRQDEIVDRCLRQLCARALPRRYQQTVNAAARHAQRQWPRRASPLVMPSGNGRVGHPRAFKVIGRRS